MANAKRRCAWKTCAQYQPVETMIIRGANAWCSDEHMIQWSIEAGRKLRETKTKEVKQKNRAELKAYRDKQLPHQLMLTKKVFNTMIRLLDRGKRCPTCDEPLVEGRYDAGHVLTVASCPQLRFDARACFGQCRKCNGSGTIRRKVKKTQEVVSELYKIWVREALGQTHYDWLYGYHPEPKWTCQDLITMRAVFSAEKLRLEKGLPPSRNWRELSPMESGQKA